MDFLQLEEKLSEYGPGGYYLVESFIIKLLQVEATQRSQELIYNSGTNISTSDLFAPKGFGEIPGPVSIEIVRSLTTQIAIREAKNFYENIKNFNASLLIISITDYNEKTVSAISSNFPSLQRIHTWGPREIQSLVNRNALTAEKLAKNLFLNRFKVAIEGKTEDWKIQKEEVINAVRDQYKSGRFSIFLGAGVSSSAGLPDWDTLLNSLFVSMLTSESIETNIDFDQISSIVKRLRQIDGPSALMLARYIRKGITADSPTEQGKFIEAVTNQLYGLRNKELPISSNLIKAIGILCAPSRTGAKMRSVLTYNFDDLLERELKSRGISYRSIFEELDLPSPEELPIYHVHGFLPENRKDYEKINKATLVFSEEGYHHIYKEAYHWSNLIQLNSLKETSCLMVGLSLTDPNLRRLLEISAKSTGKPKHFAFMKRIKQENFSIDGKKSIVRAPTSVVQKFLERHHKLNEEVFKELGVNIIWYESYDEIPNILQKIVRPA